MQTALPGIVEIVRRLENEYSSPRLNNPYDPVDEIIFILLSQKTDEAKHLDAYLRLKHLFPDWSLLVRAPISTIEDAIKGAGMGKRRAVLLKRMLCAIITRFGKLDLSALASMTPDAAERELMLLPGVGHKAARCVLLYCFNYPVLPVDVHTYRLAIRLGILSRRVAYEKSHEILQQVIPSEMRRTFHVNAVAHGRIRCFANNPRCFKCILSDLCSHPKAVKPLPIRLRPRPLAIDLFAGAGGLTLGFRRAGFQVVQAIERDSHAAATYRRNHGDVDLLEKDIRDLDPQFCMQRLGLRPGDVTALIAGPPCQGFSESNRRTRTLSNPRNHLYLEVIRFLREMVPDWFVLENVAGLRTLARGVMLRKIVEGCMALGYHVEWMVLNAADYGVPQNRRRLFVIGNKINIPIRPPPITHGPGRKRRVTVRDSLSDLPRLRSGASIDYLPYKTPRPLTTYQRLLRASTGRAKFVQGNLVTQNAKKIVRRFALIRQGQNWEAIPRRLLSNYKDPSRCHTGIYYRLEWRRVAKVIGNFRKNMLIHPSQRRGLSVREAARLQSFPDNYMFVGSIGFQQQQVADSVPPFLAEAVAHCIKTKLNVRPKSRST